MIYFSIFFSIIFFTACSLYLFRVKVSNCESKRDLISQGKRLIIYAGLFLVSLQMINDSMNVVTFLNSVCQDLLNQSKYDEFADLECKINDNIYAQAAKPFFESLLLGLSWLVPFLFASVGVNVLSQGVLMKKSEEELTEDMMLNKLTPRLRKAIKWLFKQFP